MRPDHKWDEADCVLVLDGDPLGTDAVPPAMPEAGPPSERPTATAT